MEFEWGIRNEKSSKDSLRHLKNLIPFLLPSLVSHVAYRSRSIIDAPTDAPPDTSARTPCPQVSQWHPRVAKGSENGRLSMLRPMLRHGHPAHRYLSGIPAWQRGSSKRPLARTPCPQVSQWHPRVAKGSSKWPSARPPCPQVPQWHPRVAKGVCMRGGA